MAQLDGLAKVIAQTLVPNAALIKAANDQLDAQSNQAGFAQGLLQLLQTASAPLNIRLGAAAYFKNMIARKWAPAEDSDAQPIAQQDRVVIKTHLVNLMFSSPPKIQDLLSEALRVIAATDFHENWETLLPELLQKMSSGKFEVVCGALEVVNSIIDNYRYEEIKPQSDLWGQYGYVLKSLQTPLLQMFKAACQALQQLHGKPEALAQLKEVVKALVQIQKTFHLLNCPTIPEFFENNMAEWMNPNMVLLKYENPALASKDEEEKGVVEDLKTIIIMNVSLYADKYDEEFTQWNGKFVQQVWALIVGLGDQSRYDMLVNEAINFLNVVVKKPWNKKLFSNQAALASMCEKVIIPQLKLRPSDIELFEDNGLDYVRRDMEGSDSDTRRRTAVDFVRGLMEHFEAEVSGMLKTYVMKLLQAYHASPKDQWIAKDAAMYVVLALSAQTQTRAGGVIQVNQYVNILDFFQKEVLPELKTTSSHAILRADCLKFLTIFRNQLPASAYGSVIPLLLTQLKVEDFVVHTYAACCLEKLLTVKEAGKPRISPEMIAPTLGAMLTDLFNVLKMDESQENEYVMRAVLRVCSVAKGAVAPAVGAIIGNLQAIIARVSENPRNPHFNHYVFETLSCCVAHVCKIQAAAADQFEKQLFPVFQKILSMESCLDFHPYVFQIMSQLLESHKDLPAAYQALLKSILHPGVWSNTGNVPALVRMLKAYMQRGPAIVGQSMGPVLGVFQKLLSIGSLNRWALDLLAAVFEFLPQELWGAQVKPLFGVLFTRLQKAGQNVKFKKLFIVFLCRLAVKFSGTFLIKATDQVQPGIFNMVLNGVWLPNISSIEEDDRALVAVGMTKLICHTPEFLVDPYVKAWPQCCAAIVELFEKASTSTAGDEEDDLLELAATGTTNQFSRLAFAMDSTEVDPIKSVGDPKRFLAQSLQAFSSKAPGQVPAMIKTLPGPTQKALMEYVQAAGVQIQGF